MPSLTMIDVERDFTNRVQEIENYFLFVTRLDDKNLTIVPNSTSSIGLTGLDSDSLIKTLKASCFLLMYNLVESTMKNAIQAIFDDLEVNSVEFDNCDDKVRKIILNNLKKTNADKALPNLLKLSIDIVVKTFNKNELFAGNIDARRIKDVASEYGFSSPKGDGRQLLSIKKNRNDLAHGNKSFDEIGKDYSMSELNKMQNDVKKYMQSLLKNVDDYITNKKYLAPTLAIP